ncbi:unnamed protein product [Gongylonema pulchrum]|uniref:Uncharacterized protein n=1 Tax=Gongylonema pulchrum TaxID=637853 RepID=A0A183DZI5_9BILA|nr:unnamed protein product [Gongylonema pulchrum]
MPERGITSAEGDAQAAGYIRRTVAGRGHQLQHVGGSKWSVIAEEGDESGQDYSDKGSCDSEATSASVPEGMYRDEQHRVRHSMRPSDAPVKFEMKSMRCNDCLWPDLDSTSDSDVLLISRDSLDPASGVPPEPFPSSCTDATYGWDFEGKFVRLPFSSCNLRCGLPLYPVIECALSKLLEPLISYEQIEECISSYTRVKRFDTLAELFERGLGRDVRAEYLTSVVPFMARLALQGPSLFTQVFFKLVQK